MLGVSVQVDLAPIEGNIKDAQTRAATLKAVKAGIKVINSIAKALAPRKLGHLQRSQGTKAMKGRKGKTVSLALQGARTKYKRTARAGKRFATTLRMVWPAMYDHLVIGGVKPHSIRKGSQVGRFGPSSDKAKLRARVRRGQGVGKPHPGHRANPYRKQAYDAVKSLADRIMMDVLAFEVDAMIRKNSFKFSPKMKKKK